MSVEQQHPLDHSNLLQNLFYTWSIRFVKSLKALPKLDLETIPPAPKSYNIKALYRILKKNWKHELTTKSPSFGVALVKTFFTRFMGLFFPGLFSMYGHIGIALAISELVRYFNDENAAIWEGIVFSIVLVCCSLFSCLLHHLMFFRAINLGIQIKAAGLLLLHDKCMKLKNTALQKGASTGRLINLAASDFDLFDLLGLSTYTFTVPFFLVAVAIVFYFIVGFPGLIAISVVVIYIPLLFFFGRVNRQVRLKSAKFTDERLKLVTNVIDGIRVIKLYGWEEAFVGILCHIRQKEVSSMRVRILIKTLSFAMYFTGVAVALCVTMAASKAAGDELDMGAVFGMISLLGSTFVYGVSLNGIGLETFGSYKAGCMRITQVLTLPEKNEGFNDLLDNQEASISLRNCTFSWSDMKKPGDTANTERELTADLKTSKDSSLLSDISFDLKQGELLVVVGAVGSGKTTLLLSLMGELSKIEGDFDSLGKFAYAEQEPWIISATLRDNIIMDKPYQEEFYKAVVSACCLEDDFVQMTHGDLTMIGDRGVNLSGGQKARVALARAVYANRDIYLLDDPLSAVDASVSEKLMTNCINGIISHKCRILVTHQLHVLPEADKILILNQGSSIFYGTYKQLLKDTVSHQMIGYIQTTDKKINKAAKKPAEEAEQKQKDNKTILAEERAVGNVPFSVYIRYLKESFKSWYILILVLIYCLFVQALSMFISYWIGYWSAQSSSEQENDIYLNILGIATACLVIFSLIRNNIITQNLMTSNVALHNKAASHLLKTSTTFFDSNPGGRILNIFGRDQMILDNVLVTFLGDFFQWGLVVLGVLIYVVAIMPINLVLYVILGVFIYYLKKFFIPLSRDLKRIELLSRSPIFSSLMNTLTGLVNIRCFEWQRKFSKEFTRTMRNNVKAYISNSMIMRAFQTYLDLSVIMVIASNSILLVLLTGWISPEAQSLSLAISANMMSFMAWFVKTSVETEILMTSTQRLYDYADLTAEEEKSDKVLNVTSGNIEIKGLHMKYREHLDYVLKDVNLYIAAGSKVGIVGRTGAGKSSIMQVLFRIYTWQEGQILIDGQSIAEVSLSSLRKQLSVIPQNPFIFSATVRRNLDPFDEYTEDQIWKVLKDVELADYFIAQKDQLNTELSSNAAALSVGQKQLMCLARAILRNNKILMMDEATANVDNVTDNLIQQKIRVNFQECTVITIAHRLQTVIDNDKIVVMADGRVKEYDTPAKLLQDPTSHLSYLVSFLGKKEQERLLAAANRV
jgi:ABC-type multidrug transport system fused ATPase/permease subunit